MGEHALGEHPRDPVSGGGASRMDDAAAGVSPLEAEVVVELDAELDEVADPGGRLSGQGRHRARAGEATSRAQGVLRMQGGCVVRADRGGDAALRE